MLCHAYGDILSACITQILNGLECNQVTTYMNMKWHCVLHSIPRCIYHLFMVNYVRWHRKLVVARGVTMLKHSNVSLHLTHTPESPIMSQSKHVNPYSKPLISLVRLCSTKYSGAAIKPTIHNKTVINLKLFDAVAAIKFSFGNVDQVSKL